MKTAARTTSFNRQSPIGNRQYLAWQGFELRTPADWNAVKLEGDERQGMVLLADLSSARLGLRWATPKKSKSSPEELVRNAMRNEVGDLATKEARRLATPLVAQWSSQLLYEEPDPPGRDVWIGLSKLTNRLVQLTYQAGHRDGVLANDLLPAFTEQATGAPQRWSVLDVSCEVPPGFNLTSHQLSAGDLRLSFEAPGRRRIMVRQMGPADLALSRQPMHKWLDQQLASSRALYRRCESESVEVEADERRLVGVCATARRKRRAFLHRALPMELTTLALHDPARDRIIIAQANDRALADEVALSVGWATRGERA